MRFYETPEGKFYPSITTVLGGTMSKEKEASLKSWQNSLGMTKAMQVTQDAADHGTAVHLMIERFLKGEQIDQGEKFDSKRVSAFNALKTALKKIDEVWCQEAALYSDIIEVAGRCDCVGVYKGVPSIIDFKTSMSIKNNERVEDYRLQLCAYAIMHNEMFGTEITNGVIIMSSDGGFPQVFNVDLLEYVDKLMVRVDQFYQKLSSSL
jgi:genome maintenance exonuclease 1